jgi:hypothetical protein
MAFTGTISDFERAGLFGLITIDDATARAVEVVPIDEWNDRQPLRIPAPRI